MGFSFFLPEEGSGSGMGFLSSSPRSSFFPKIAANTRNEIIIPIGIPANNHTKHPVKPYPIIQKGTAGTHAKAAESANQSKNPQKNPNFLISF